jgi:hypothetical protein
MVDIAHLGLAIDSSAADHGTLSLDKMAAAARKLEDNAMKMATGTTGAFKTIGGGVDAAAKKLEDNALKMSGAFSKVGKGANDLDAAVKKLTASANPLKPALDSIANDNITRSLDSATHSAGRFHDAIERVREFSWQNSTWSGDQIDRIINPIQLLGRTLGALPATALVAAAGVEVALSAIGASARRQLAELDEVARRSGLSVNDIAGAQIIGARAGLTTDVTRQALGTAGAQFDAYRRNEGAVKDALEKIDEGLLKLTDRARSAGDFIDIVGERIRALPREEALDLSRALFGDDAGAKLFEPIRSGELSMRALGDAAARAGGLNEELARHAADVERQVDAAAEIAKTKMLVAFQDLGNPVDNIRLGWWNIVGSIGDAIQRSEELRQVMQGLLHPIDTLMNAPNVVRGLFTPPQAAPIGRLIDLQQGADFEKLRAQWMAAGPQIVFPTAGESRARFAAREDAATTTSRAASGRSPADDAARLAERYDHIVRNLEMQRDLLRSTGDAHDRIALQLETERQLHALGTKATAEQRDHVRELVADLDQARKAHERMTEQALAFNAAYGAASRSAAGVVKDALSGKDISASLQNAADRARSDVLDAFLTGDGPYAAIFGTKGKNGATGGLFGSAADLLGLGPGGDQATQRMNVQAQAVYVNGAVSGAPGAAGGGGLLGLIGDLFKDRNANFAGQAPGAIGPFPEFALGGVMTAHGELPLHRYATGGVATSPQLALFGEGRMAEAFVPLPDGRSIPVTMQTPQTPPQTPPSYVERGGTVVAPAPKTEVHLHGAPAGTEVQESRRPDGGLNINVLLRAVDKHVGKGIAEGRYDKPLTSSFPGMRRGTRPF